MTGSRDVLRNFNADGLDSLYPRYAGGPTWLVGRHHWLLALARIGREVLPFLPLMPDAEEQVARLVELHADDAATELVIRGCSPRPWWSWPRPPVRRWPWPRAPSPTRCSGYTGSWVSPSHWAALAGSCFAPPPWCLP